MRILWLFGTFLAISSGRGDSGTVEDGAGCRFDSFLWTAEYQMKITHICNKFRYKATNLQGCRPTADQEVVSNSPDECRDKCKEMDGCRFWSHAAEWDECYLRGGNVTKVPAEGYPGYTSGSTLSCGMISWHHSTM